MNPLAQTLTDTLQLVREVHLPAHRCTDGIWYNRNAGAREACPTAAAMATAIETVAALDHAVADAAGDPEAVRHVCWAMTGFDSDTLDAMDAEQRDGWLETAQSAITGLAGWLSPDDDVQPGTLRVVDC